MAGVATCAAMTLGVSACAAPRPQGPKLFTLPLSARAMDLTPDSRPDPRLQADLAQLDRVIGDELGIPADRRAVGVVDPVRAQWAAVNPDTMFYGASVPKIAIVLAYLIENPAVVENPEPRVMHDLQRIIKESDNELAATYSQRVGLSRIQAMLESPAYRLYDREHGGGIWCGKHYGIDLPRVGDPLRNLSHAATVRQCLRYYLLLEQDRLGSPAVCRRLREVFAAPWADFHDDYFVKAVRGLDLRLIRKNGLWEDWHLDTARIELPDRPLLLAGMVHHPRGPEYLSRIGRAWIMLARGAATPADALREADQPQVASWRTYRHVRLHHADQRDFASGRMIRAAWAGSSSALALNCSPGADATFESEPVDSAFKFNEVLLSWNIGTPADCGFTVELAVGRRIDDSWSPWLHVGDWGVVPGAATRTTRFDGGRIDIDCFVSERRFDRFRYRIRASTRAAGGRALLVHRVDACFSDLTGLPDSWTPPDPAPRRGSPPEHLWKRRLDVPFRSQRTERAELAGRICSPTSVSMVLEHRGLAFPTLKIAELCHDPAHDLYGVWPRNIQAAFVAGAPGYVTRFSDWSEVEQCIADGQPLVISIRVNRPGMIHNSPYKTTDGHLIVLCGFDPSGDVYVNDPAVSDPERGRLVYRRSELEEAWFGGSGGVAYVLLPARRDRPLAERD